MSVTLSVRSRLALVFVGTLTFHVFALEEILQTLGFSGSCSEPGLSEHSSTWDREEHQCSPDSELLPWVQQPGLWKNNFPRASTLVLPQDPPEWVVWGSRWAQGTYGSSIFSLDALAFFLPPSLSVSMSVCLSLSNQIRVLRSGEGHWAWAGCCQDLSTPQSCSLSALWELNTR